MTYQERYDVLSKRLSSLESQHEVVLESFERLERRYESLVGRVRAHQFRAAEYEALIRNMLGTPKKEWRLLDRARAWVRRERELCLILRGMLDKYGTRKLEAFLRENRALAEMSRDEVIRRLSAELTVKQVKRDGGIDVSHFFAHGGNGKK